jgi:hypothetical protein
MMDSLKWFGYGVFGVFLLATGVNTVSADINSDSTSNAGATAGSAAGAVSQQGQSININSAVPANTSHTQKTTHNQRLDTDTHKIRQNPNVISPDLITSHSQDLCVGSAAGGASGGGVGLSFGGTIKDHDCIRRRDSTLLFNMGHEATAKELMCDSLRVYAAFRRSSQPCAERTAFEKKLAKVEPQYD